MSEGLSLGVDHQMLVNEYSPKAVDDSQALDDITERLTQDSLDLSDGNEALVMLAAHAPEAIPTDLELEVLLHRVRDTVLAYLAKNTGDTHIDVQGLDTPLIDIGLEDYKQVLLVVKDRVIKAIRWLGKQFMNAYKRLSDRLGRLSVRLMMIERKIDSSNDSAIPTDTIKLPPSASMLALFGKTPANASEVMNAVNKVKWLFTTIHNDYTLFQSVFKRAMDSGNRAEVLELIRDHLGHLASRLNARPDPQRNGRLVFNQLPNNYIVEISQGDSFTDCWATINRTGVMDVTGEESRRPDRASLSRLIGEQRTFLKVVNELYGKVGTRLTTDFRNLVRDAERSLESSNTDNRTIESTVNWFTEQQNRLFYRSMVLACGSMSAALDYCVVALRAGNVGNEALDDDDTFSGTGAPNRLNQLDQFFISRQAALADASVGLTAVGAALESLSANQHNPDFSVRQLLELDLEALLPATQAPDYFWSDTKRSLGDYPTTLITLLENVQRELQRFNQGDMATFKRLLKARSTSNDTTSALLQQYGYLGETGYVQYLLIDGTTPTSSAGVVEGAVAGVCNLAELLGGFRTRTERVTAALADSDVLVSRLFDVVGANANSGSLAIELTAGFQVHPMTAKLGFGDVTLARATLDPDRVRVPTILPTCDADAAVTIQELLVKLVEMDDGLAGHWGEINQLVSHTGRIQEILLVSMARCNKGCVDEWLLDGLRYLEMMFTEIRWQSRLLRDLMMYREGLILSLCFYQRT